MNRTRLIKSVALMMGATLIGKALLAVREPIIAAYFGAGAETDAYNVAMTIVTMLLGVTISPIDSVLVPVYVERLHQDRVEGERFIRQVLTLYLLILSSVSLIAYFVTPWLVSLYAPGFSPETLILAVRLTRILVFFAVASGLAGYCGLVLTSHEEFLWVALAPVATSVLTLVILLAAAPSIGIDALAWGMVVGNAVQMFLLWFSARRQLVRLTPSLHLGEAVRALGGLSSWMLVGRFIGQGHDLIDQNMLSHLGEGSIAALGFARSIYLLPFSIFTTGITRVIIANFSWDVTRGDIEALKRDLSLAIRMAAFFMIPVTVGLIALRHLIVQFLYQRGAFDILDAEVTAMALMLLSVGLVFRVLNFIVGRLFLSMRFLVFPTVITLGSLIVHLIANLLLVPTFGLSGVAISLTITEVVVATSFLVKARQVIGPLGGKRIMTSLAKMGAASGVMAFILFLGRFLGVSLDGNAWVQFVTLAGIVSAGGVSYIIALYLSRSEELLSVARLAKQVLFDRTQAASASSDDDND